MLTLVGRGPADAGAMSLAARDTLRAAKSLFIRTSVHPAVDDLIVDGVSFESFDSVYETADSFDVVYQTIVDTLLKALFHTDVTYAVPGHPLVAEETVRRLIAECRDRGIPFKIVSSASFIEPALSALQLSLDRGIVFADALSMDTFELKPDLDLILYQVFDQQAASNTKLALMAEYPHDWQVTVVCAAGVPGVENVSVVPLHKLDRAKVDHLTVVYVPLLPKDQRKCRFDDLVWVMARLRGEGGCPWDREQDHHTLKRYFIEETYEAIEAIDNGDMDSLCEELGDVLLQVVFHAQLESEIGVFDIRDVIKSIVDKLIRRHPHVFGTLDVADSDEVLRNWEAIKKTEKGDGWRESVLDGVPVGLPALMRAMEISKRAVKVGFEWENLDDVFTKLEEELAELKEAVRAGNDSEISSEIGDLLFTVVNIARWKKVDPEDSLREMVNRFTRRFQYVEAGAKSSGRDIKSLSLSEMDALWDEAKTTGL